MSEAEDNFTSLDSLPEELAWMRNLDLSNPDLVKMVQHRIAGIEYFAAYLITLSNLPVGEQHHIAKLIYENQ